MDLDKETDIEMDMYTYMSKNSALAFSIYFYFAKNKDCWKYYIY